MHRLILAISLIIAFVSCAEDKVYIPKPRLYPKIDFPTKEYQKFDVDYCAMEFNYPSYAEIDQDKKFLELEQSHACWFDIVIPSLNGRIHCNYNEITDRASFDDLINDAYTLAGKHNSKAEYYKEIVLRFPNQVSGIVFEIEGDVATPIQFYLTDSTNHFFRGSLYFNNKVNVDSMMPVYDFVKSDIDTLLESFRWK